MTQTSNRILDEFAKMFGNAASAAQGVRSEVDTLIRAQAERILNDLDVVQREEFEAVREMAAKAREENEALKARIDALETALKSAGTAKAGKAGTAKTARTARSTAKTSSKGASAKATAARKTTAKASGSKAGNAKSGTASTVRRSTD